MENNLASDTFDFNDAKPRFADGIFIHSNLAAVSIRSFLHKQNFMNFTNAIILSNSFDDFRLRAFNDILKEFDEVWWNARQKPSKSIYATIRTQRKEFDC